MNKIGQLHRLLQSSKLAVPNGPINDVFPQPCLITTRTATSPHLFLMPMLEDVTRTLVRTTFRKERGTFLSSMY